MSDFSKTKDWNQRWKRRDRAMADNIKWILNQAGSNRKALIVAHNFHISMFNENEEVMGELLKKAYGEEIYGIGTFARSGTFLDNRGRTQQLSAPNNLALDIKHIIQNDSAAITFMVTTVPEKGYEWLYKPIVVNDTFIDLSNSNTLVLSKCFDALLLLDSVSTPAK